MAFRNIQFEEPESGIGLLTLNRPDCLNALSMDMVEELHALFRELDNRHEVRVLLIAGRGRGFCAGADLRDDRIIGPAMSRDAAFASADYFCHQWTGGGGWHVHRHSVGCYHRGASGRFHSFLY